MRHPSMASSHPAAAFHAHAQCSSPRIAGAMLTPQSETSTGVDAEQGGSRAYTGRVERGKKGGGGGGFVFYRLRL